jgi:hypothetical protein
MWVNNLNCRDDFPCYFVLGATVGSYSACEAHNEAVQTFLDSPFDYLWLWADDMSPTQSSAHIFSVDADVRVPLVPIWSQKHGRPLWCVKEGTKLGQVQDYEAPYTPDHVGTGAMLIKRHVLEALKLDDSTWFRDYFDDRGHRTKGHDFDFCDRVKDAGFSLLVVPTAIADHHKTINLLSLMRSR